MPNTKRRYEGHVSNRERTPCPHNEHLNLCMSCIHAPWWTNGDRGDTFNIIKTAFDVIKKWIKSSHNDLATEKKLSWNVFGWRTFNHFDNIELIPCWCHWSSHSGVTHNQLPVMHALSTPFDQLRCAMVIYSNFNDMSHSFMVDLVVCH